MACLGFVSKISSMSIGGSKNKNHLVHLNFSFGKKMRICSLLMHYLTILLLN
jgi:hypothetical protein